MASKREVSIIIRAVDRASRVLRSVSNNATKDLKRVGDAAQNAARSIGLIGAALSLSLGLAINTTADFQQSMANTQSVIGATVEELGLLTDAAREMGKVSVFSASQAADAMFFLASAGLNTEKVIAALGGTMDLAAATMSELSFTTETVVSTLAAFGLQAQDSDRVANVFAATISGSQATMEKLATAMSFVAPVARAVNLSLEETSAILGRLFTSGIAASTAGTALRMAFSQLLKPSEDAKEALDRLRIVTKTADGNIRNFVDIIRDLEVAGLTAADAMTIFGVRAGPALLTLVNQGAGAIDDLTKRITGTNKAAEMAALQIDTFKGQMLLLKSATQELQIVIGNQLLPLLTDLAQKLTIIVTKVADWTKGQQALTKVLGTSAIALTALLLSVSAFGFLLSGVIKGVAGISAGIGFLGKAFFALGNTTLILKARLALLAVGMGTVATAAGVITVVLGAVAGAYFFLKKTIVDTTAAFVEQDKGIERGKNQLIGIKAALADHVRALEQVEEAQEKGALSVSLFGTALKRADDTMKSFDKDILPVNEQILRLRRRIQLLNEQLRIAGGDIFNTANELRNASKVIQALFNPLETLGKWLVDTGQKAKDMASAFVLLRGDMEFLKADSPQIQGILAAREHTELWAKAVGDLKDRMNELFNVLPTDAGRRRILFFPETIDELIERIRLQERLNRIIGGAPILGMARDIPTPIPLPPGFGPSEEALASFETAFAQAQGRMKDIALANLAEQVLAFRNAKIDEEQVNDFARLRTTQLDEEFRNKTLEKSQALIMTLQQSRIAAEIEAFNAIENIRETAFQMEQARIKDMGQSYASFIRSASSIGRRFFSEQKAGWLRALAALIRFTTRAIAGSLKERALEKLKQAEQANTAAQFQLQLSAKLAGLAAEAGAMALLATAQGILFGDPKALAAAKLFGAAAIDFGIAAKVAVTEAAGFKGTATILQGEAAALMTASVAVQASGELVASGIDLAADAAQRAARAEQGQARDTEQRLQTELNLRQKILEMEGRTAEARRLGLEAEADRLRGLGIDENLVNRFEQLSLRQTGQTGGNIAVDTGFSPIPAVAGVGSGGTVIHQTNTFIGITDLSNQDQLRELAIALRPFNEEIEDLETQA